MNDSTPIVENRSSIDDIPDARRGPGFVPIRMTRLWWLTGISVGLAMGLMAWAWWDRGVLIHVQFSGRVWSESRKPIDASWHRSGSDRKRSTR